MLLIVSILSLIVFHFIYSVSSSSECPSPATIWTYYPCSFIISSSSSPSQSSLSCQEASISLSIDECTNREMMFFWHFPSGNITITLQSEKHRSFLLRLFQISALKRKLIKNIYHVVKNGTIDDEVLNSNGSEMITVWSNEKKECSIKFERSTELVFEYGTFIRMIIMTDDDMEH